MKVLVKEKLYNYFVRKNGRVWYEYERYVREHMEEHRTHKFRHLKVLMKLNWFYRVKKGNTPYLYWDVPLSPQKKNVSSGKKVESGSNKSFVTESQNARKLDEYRMMKYLLSYDVISFDVFDTLLLRPFSDPYDAFILLQEKYNQINFDKIRKNAAKSVFEKKKICKGESEISLQDIYREINHQTGIPIDEGIKNEIELEENICYANKYFLTVLELLKAQGKKIIAVSDMYLSKDTIASLLYKNGFDGFEKIYVSCEFGYGKKEGLFKNVREDYKGLKIVHIGDNKEKDFKMPQKEGIDAYLYRGVNYSGNPFRVKGLSGIISSAYKGIINAELHSGENRYNAVYEYGFVYGGIYILGYTNWVSQTSKLLNAEKVLFLARDGYILHKVYTNILKENNSKYVFWSRLAGIRICAQKDKYTFIEDTLRRRKKDKKFITVQKWLEIMNLQILEPHLSDFNICLDNPLNEVTINRLELLLTEKWEEVINCYEEESNAAKKYFEEIIGSAKKILLVDIGWQGQSILLLKWLIMEHWKLGCSVECAMAASYPNDETANQCMLLNESIHIYSFSLQKEKDIYRFFLKNNDKTVKSWLEFFTQAPHPTFERFYLEENNVRFSFGFPEVENYEFINIIQNGIYHFCELYVDKFKRYPFMYNISGADALIPFMSVFNNKKMMVNVFSDVVFPLDTFSSAMNITPIKAIKQLEGISK